MGNRGGGGKRWREGAGGAYGREVEVVCQRGGSLDEDEDENEVERGRC